ncbi:MAG: hypothetical protein OXG67_05775 [bacterium]|nr:hypothetical protein [bacterium]
MSVNNQEQLSDPPLARDGIDLVGGLLAVMALGIAVIAMIGPVFPWWVRAGWEWQWFIWDLSGLRVTTENQYSGLAVTVFGFFCGFCSFISIMNVIIRPKSPFFAIPKLILSGGAIITVVAGLDLASGLTSEYWNPGFGIIVSFLAGLGLMVVATGMIVLFTVRAKSYQHDRGNLVQTDDIKDFD